MSRLSSAVGAPGCACWLHYLQPVWLWTSHLTSLWVAVRIYLANTSKALSTEPGYGKQTRNISCSYLQSEGLKELLEIKEDSTFLVCVFIWEEVQGHSPQIELEPSRKEEKGGDSGWPETTTTTWPSPVVYGLFPMSQAPLPSSHSSFPAPIPSGERLQAAGRPGQDNERAKT